MSKWRSPETLVPEGGAEILVRLKNDGSGNPRWIGASVHQIASWNLEGDLFSHGIKIDLDHIEGWAPLPDHPLK